MSTNPKIIICLQMQMCAREKGDEHHTYRLTYTCVYEGKGHKWGKTALAWNYRTKSQSGTIQRVFSFPKIKISTKSL